MTITAGKRSAAASGGIFRGCIVERRLLWIFLYPLFGISFHGGLVVWRSSQTTGVNALESHRSYPFDLPGCSLPLALVFRVFSFLIERIRSVGLHSPMASSHLFLLLRYQWSLLAVLAYCLDRLAVFHVFTW